MKWTDDILEQVNPIIEKHSYRVAASLLSDRLHEHIDPEQLRSARRRWLRRQYNDSLHIIPSVVDMSSTLYTSRTPYVAYAHNERTNGHIPIPAKETFPKELHTKEIPIRDAHVQNAHARDAHAQAIPDPYVAQPVEILTIPHQNVLVIGDLHAPYHDVETIQRAITITHTHFPHIKDIAIIGDLYDFGAVSRYVQDDPTGSPLSEDLRIGGELMRFFLQEFQDVWLCGSNHDSRIRKRLNTVFTLEHLLCGSLGNTNPYIHISDLDYIHIGDTIVAGHPESYSHRPTHIANRAALLLTKNIITAHSHKVGITLSDDGVHWAVDNGCVCSPDIMYYVRRRLNTFSRMARGFTIIDGGKPFVFGDGITNWSWWMR